jgi:hypothetical protein
VRPAALQRALARIWAIQSERAYSRFGVKHAALTSARTLQRSGGPMPALCVGLVAALSVCSAVTAVTGTPQQRKLRALFQMVDASGGLLREYDAAGGNACDVKGVTCTDNNVVTMCAPILRN